MVIARFSMPDGKVGRFEVPDGTTPEMAQNLIQQHISGQPQGENAGPNAAFGEALANGVPFGQRITSGLGALGAAALGAGNVKDLYNQAQENTQTTAEANPNSSLLGTAAGITPTLLMGGGAAKWAAKPIFSTSGTLADIGNAVGQSAKGALVAAPVGAAYNAGTAPTINDMPEAAKAGATLTGAIGAGAPIASAALGGLVNAGKGMVARNADKLESAGQAMFKNAGDVYERMKEVGAVLNPMAASKVSSEVENAVNKLEFIPELNPKTMAIINRIKEVASTGKIGLNELDQYRRLLGRIGPTEDGVSAGAARKAIDKVVNDLTGKDMLNGSTKAIDLLNKGRSQYSQASKFDDVADILRRADGDPNRIKSGLTRFLNDPDNYSGWSEDEIQALKEAAKSTTGEKLLKMGGKFGIDLGTSLTPGNTVAPLIGALAGTSEGGMLTGAAVPIAGTALRQTQKFIARGKGENLLKTIENGTKNIVNNSETKDLIERYGSSALGKFMAQNKDIPIKSLEDIPPDVMQEVMKMSPKDAQSFFKSLKGIK